MVYCSPCDWVGFHPLYNLTNQGSLHGSIGKNTPPYRRIPPNTIGAFSSSAALRTVIRPLTSAGSIQQITGPAAILGWLVIFFKNPLLCGFLNSWLVT